MVSCVHQEFFFKFREGEIVEMRIFNLANFDKSNKSRMQHSLSTMLR